MSDNIEGIKAQRLKAMQGGPPAEESNPHREPEERPRREPPPEEGERPRREPPPRDRERRREEPRVDRGPIDLAQVDPGPLGELLRDLDEAAIDRWDEDEQKALEALVLAWLNAILGVEPRVITRAVWEPWFTDQMPPEGWHPVDTDEEARKFADEISANLSALALAIESQFWRLRKGGWALTPSVRSNLRVAEQWFLARGIYHFTGDADLETIARTEIGTIAEKIVNLGRNLLADPDRVLDGAVGPLGGGLVLDPDGWAESVTATLLGGDPEVRDLASTTPLLMMAPPGGAAFREAARRLDVFLTPEGRKFMGSLVNVTRGRLKEGMELTPNNAFIRTFASKFGEGFPAPTRIRGMAAAEVMRIFGAGPEMRALLTLLGSPRVLDYIKYGDLMRHAGVVLAKAGIEGTLSPGALALFIHRVILLGTRVEPAVVGNLSLELATRAAVLSLRRGNLWTQKFVRVPLYGKFDAVNRELAQVVRRIWDDPALRPRLEAEDVAVSRALLSFGALNLPRGFAGNFQRELILDPSFVPGGVPAAVRDAVLLAMNLALAGRKATKDDIMAGVIRRRGLAGREAFAAVAAFRTARAGRVAAEVVRRRGLDPNSAEAREILDIALLTDEGWGNFLVQYFDDPERALGALERVLRFGQTQFRQSRIRRTINETEEAFLRGSLDAMWGTLGALRAQPTPPSAQKFLEIVALSGLVTPAVAAVAGISEALTVPEVGINPDAELWVLGALLGTAWGAIMEVFAAGKLGAFDLSELGGEVAVSNVQAALIAYGEALSQFWSAVETRHPLTATAGHVLVGKARRDLEEKIEAAKEGSSKLGKDCWDAVLRTLVFDARLGQLWGMGLPAVVGARTGIDSVIRDAGAALGVPRETVEAALAEGPPLVIEGYGFAGAKPAKRPSWTRISSRLPSES